MWTVSSGRFPVAVVGRRDWETVVSGTTKMTASGGEMAYLSRRSNHEKLAKGVGGWNVLESEEGEESREALGCLDV